MAPESLNCESGYYNTSTDVAFDQDSPAGTPRWFLPSTESDSTIEYRLEARPFIPIWRLGMSRSVHPGPRQGAIGCEKTAVRRMARARRPSVLPYRSDDIGRHVGAGFGRRPPISRRIAVNSRRGIATSASWNATHRPCRTILAPILISFSRSIVNDQCWPPATAPMSPSGQ